MKTEAQSIFKAVLLPPQGTASCAHFLPTLSKTTLFFFHLLFVHKYLLCAHQGPRLPPGAREVRKKRTEHDKK